jgi:hypothetical protein
MHSIRIRLIGSRPILLNSDISLDRFHPLTREKKRLTDKRRKTDDDEKAIAQLEWRAALYWDDAIGVYIPGVNIDACMLAGAKLSKLGTTVRRGAETVEERCKLIYDGPKDIEGLWAAGFYDARGVVKNGRSRVMCYRPIFREWSVEATIGFDIKVIDREQVVRCITDGGRFSGLGTYRPRFGRFDVKLLEG